MWGLGGPLLRPRILLLSIPPFLLALQLLLLLIIVGSGLPGAAHVRDRDGAVAFAVLSIEPERSAQRRGASVQSAAREEEAGRVYVDENEIQERQIGPRELEVQLWAADTPSFAAEVNRFVAYINTPQYGWRR
ncbi:hypothetical protein OJAV_G00108490 [Oryzias javanicus]|uniref:Uncharacterized protein n=1 Tax=Oryzias javanicus TaxID=123683 RepID=A0A3S2PH11_ORYJA|nr:hypothetical protein OJAV_G00108490 [Oryzias javanicus]